MWYKSAATVHCEVGDEILKNLGIGKKKLLIGLITLLLGASVAVPISFIVHEKHNIDNTGIHEKNKLTSQVLMTGTDYQLNYEREEKLKKEMDERVEQIEKEEAQQPPQKQPETSVEIIEKITKDEEESVEDKKEEANEENGDENGQSEPSENNNSGSNQGNTGNNTTPNTGSGNNSNNGTGNGVNNGESSSEGSGNKPHIDDKDQGQDDEWGFETDEREAEKNRVIPRLTVAGLKNGATYKGTTHTFYLRGKDYKGRNIWDGGRLDVLVNGEKVYGYVTGTGNLDIHYTFDLRKGNNDITIIMVDREGHRRQESYRVQGSPSENKDMFRVVDFYLDLSNLGIGTPDNPVLHKEVVVYEGETMGYVINKALSEEGYTVHFGTANNYIPAISKPGILEGWNIPEAKKAFIQENGGMWGAPMLEANGEYQYDRSLGTLKEKDFFRGSGWCVSAAGSNLNPNSSNNIPNGVQAYVISDNICSQIWVYWTNCLGYDFRGKWYNQ